MVLVGLYGQLLDRRKGELNIGNVCLLVVYDYDQVALFDALSQPSQG